MATKRKSYKRQGIVVEYSDQQGLTDFKIEQQVKNRQRSLEHQPTDYREGIIAFQKRAGENGDSAAFHAGADGISVDAGQYRVTRRQRRIIAGVRLEGKRIPYTVLAEEKRPRRVRDTKQG